MAALLLEQVVAGRTPPPWAISLEQYHDMIRSGVLPDCSPIELIDGFLMRKDRGGKGNSMSVHPRHAMVVSLLPFLLALLENTSLVFRSQQPVTLPPDSEPEPDGAIVRGPLQRYSQRHPNADEIVAIMEVSDTSLTYDRNTKGRLYASAGVPFYWIVNLQENVIEVYTQPNRSEGRYEQKEIYTVGQSAPLTLGEAGTIHVAVSELLS